MFGAKLPNPNPAAAKAADDLNKPRRVKPDMV
jgi:hypothetical protein